MLIKLAFLLTFYTSLVQVNCLICYNCGYLEMPDGSKVPIREEFGKVPFCEDFTTNEENTKMAYHVRYRPSIKLPLDVLYKETTFKSLIINTILYYYPLQGGCCSAFKVEVKDENTQEQMWLSRHGTASDEDELWTNFTCGETVRFKLYKQPMCLSIK